MRLRWLKRGLLWVIQAGLVTGLAWLLLRWNYWDRLRELVPYTVPTFHHLKMLFVAETLITGALAGAIALIFAPRVERWPLAYAPGVMLCTCVVLWAYVFVALYGDDVFEVNTVFLGRRNYLFYCVIVVTWVGVVNGVLSLVAGVANRVPVVLREPADLEQRPRRVRLADVAQEVESSSKESTLVDGGNTGKIPKAIKTKIRKRG